MPAKIRVLNLTELRKIPPPETLCGTPLVANSLNIVFGPSGAYKSFYMLHQALTIAQEFPVAFVIAEGSPGYARRIDAWGEHHKMTPNLKNLWFIPHEINLLHPESVAAAIAAIQEKTKRAALTVIDTYARCIVGGDENGFKDTGMAIHQCTIMQRALKGATGLIHHTNKAGTSERGHGSLRGAADLMIEISADDGLIKVRCDKNKDGPEWADEHYRFMTISESGVLTTSDETPALKITNRELDVLAFLDQSVFSEAGAKINQIKEALNLPLRSTYRILSTLKERCAIDQGKTGDPYRLNGTGRIALYAKRAKTKLKPETLFEMNDIEISVSDCQINAKVK